MVNVSMQKIVASDLVRDEYGNYYEVVGTHLEGETLTAIEVSNLYFEKSFQIQMDETYKDKPVGVLIQEHMNAYIEAIEKNNRPIYGIRDLMVNQIKVYAVDVTQPHPKRNQTV